MKRILSFIIPSLLIVFSCQKERKPPVPIAMVDSTTFKFDWSGMSLVMMRRMNLEPKERVLIVAEPGRFDSLIEHIKERLEKGNGEYLGTISIDSANWPATWRTSFVDGTAGMDLKTMTGYLNDVDVAIMMPGATTNHVPYVAMQKVLARGRGRTIHFHWSGAYGIDGALLPLTEDIDEFYQNAVLNTNHRGVSELQQFFEEAARKMGVTVTTPSGTNIKFELGDRPVTKQDGDASKGRTAFARNLIDREIEVPVGAIRVAPMEESVEGTIAFPDGQWNSKPVTGLVFTIHKGKITDMKATTGLESVKAELDKAGAAGYSFREFALGFNPLLAVPESGERWIPYYGYGSGVVRLSLGDNTELGGKVTGGYVRWNFFTDATVSLGQQVIVKDGKMRQ